MRMLMKEAAGQFDPGLPEVAAVGAGGGRQALTPVHAGRLFA